ncbi:MAG: hypothetical protein ACLPX1_06805, partial [Steroidobacteraceae bacterium]
MRFLPVIFVALLGAYNAYCAIRGLNKLPSKAGKLARVELWVLGILGLVFACGAAYFALDQQRQNEGQGRLLRELAVAAGIDPDDATEHALDKAIKKRLG